AWEREIAAKATTTTSPAIKEANSVKKEEKQVEPFDPDQRSQGTAALATENAEPLIKRVITRVLLKENLTME
uniref:Uncharacterized protein n=1 Tax=Cucumis melo TaxID=3656 RepID=A0A9I9E1W6_CUCME